VRRIIDSYLALNRISLKRTYPKYFRNKLNSLTACFLWIHKSVDLHPKSDDKPIKALFSTSRVLQNINKVHQNDLRQ